MSGAMTFVTQHYEAYEKLEFMKWNCLVTAKPDVNVPLESMDFVFEEL